MVQHPNFFGGLEEVEALAQAAHSKGALFVVSFDPISLGLLIAALALCVLVALPAIRSKREEAFQE